MSSRRFYIPAATALLGTVMLGMAIEGCNGTHYEDTNQLTTPTQVVSGSGKRDAATNVADPSVKSCIDQGFDVVPIESNGITVSYMCADVETGKKCDSWSFYRKECLM